MKYKDTMIGAPSKTYKRCYESHPPLPIGEFQIYGGSCISPVVSDADIYVGFDRGMQMTSRMYPWNDGHDILFPIVDRGVPSSKTEAIKLVDWLALNLSANAKMHLGCIGGHGRTGTILAALVKVVLGETDAITYVRDKYCNKAVESAAQVDWLASVFGVTKVACTDKGHGNQLGTAWPATSGKGVVTTFSTHTKYHTTPDSDVRSFEPLHSSKWSICGNNAI